MGVAGVSFHPQHPTGRMDSNKKNIAYVRIKTEEDDNQNEDKFQSIKLYTRNLYNFIHPKINHLLNNHSNLCIGLTMCFLSIFLFTLNIFLIKRFSVIISDILFVRSMIQLCGISAIIFYCGDTLLPQSHSNKSLTVIQGVTGSVTFICGYTCLTFINVPDTFCILSSYNILAVLVLSIWKDRNISSFQYLSSIFLFIGSILTTQPSFLFSHNVWATFLQVVSQPGNLVLGSTLAIFASISWLVTSLATTHCKDVSAVFFSPGQQSQVYLLLFLQVGLNQTLFFLHAMIHHFLSWIGCFYLQSPL